MRPCWRRDDIRADAAGADDGHLWRHDDQLCIASADRPEVGQGNGLTRKVLVWDGSRGDVAHQRVEAYYQVYAGPVADIGQDRREKALFGIDRETEID